MKSPRKWPSGRLAQKINLARSGDHLAGRELLGIASLQLKQFDDLEPDLRRYLEQLLLDLSRCTPTDTARVSNTAPPRNPKNRPKNEQRIKAMLAAWNVARTAPIIDRGDDTNIRILARKISQIMYEPEQYAQSVDLLDEVREAERFGSRSSTSEDTYKLAARIFNHILTQAQKDGYRVDEVIATPSAIKAAVNRVKRIATV